MTNLPLCDCPHDHCRVGIIEAKCRRFAPSEIGLTINNVPVAQTGERSQQGTEAGSLLAASRPQVAEVAGAIPVRDSSASGAVKIPRFLHDNPEFCAVKVADLDVLEASREAWMARTSAPSAEQATYTVFPMDVLDALLAWSGAEPSQSVLARVVEHRGEELRHLQWLGGAVRIPVASSVAAREELELIRSVLYGYPASLARIDALRAVHALLDAGTAVASEAARLPDGWTLVPTIPNPEMYAHGENARHTGSDAQGIYIRMLDHSPEGPVASAQPARPGEREQIAHDLGKLVRTWMRKKEDKGDTEYHIVKLVLENHAIIDAALTGAPSAIETTGIPLWLVRAKDGVPYNAYPRRMQAEVYLSGFAMPQDAEIVAGTFTPLPDFADSDSRGPK